MINKLLNKLLLPKHENEINLITADLALYWEKTNDFSLACLRYFQDLNTKYELGFTNTEIAEIASTIITKSSIQLGLPNANTMLLYGEFLYYAVFGGKSPSYVRNKKENIFFHLGNFENYVIPNPSPWNDKITKVLNRNYFIS